MAKLGPTTQLSLPRSQLSNSAPIPLAFLGGKHHWWGWRLVDLPLKLLWAGLPFPSFSPFGGGGMDWGRRACQGLSCPYLGSRWTVELSRVKRTNPVDQLLNGQAFAFVSAPLALDTPPEPVGGSLQRSSRSFSVEEFIHRRGLTSKAPDLLKRASLPGPKPAVPHSSSWHPPLMSKQKELCSHHLPLSTW